MKFLFWNVNRRALDDLVVDLASEHNVDLVMLAEYAGDPFVLLDLLNRDNGFGFYSVPTLSDTIRLFVRFSPDYARAVFDSPRITIHSFSLPARVDFILAVVHMPSKLFWSDDSQMLECTRLSNIIRRIEVEVGHDRTILVGDLNMNPFEKGIIGAAGLNAAMTRRTAAKGARTVQAEAYPFFYNPMWNGFGDDNNEVCGTYYHDSGQHVNYYWNLFDQVLFRPALLEWLPERPAKIVTQTSTGSLLSEAGAPSTTVGSDHLPLVFSVNV